MISPLNRIIPEIGLDLTDVAAFNSDPHVIDIISPVHVPGVSAEIMSGETDDPADAEAADSEVSADGAEPAMTNEELDEYLQRLINEDDA